MAFWQEAAKLAGAVSVGAILVVIGIWVGRVNSDRETLKQIAEDIRNDLKEITRDMRSDLKGIRVEIRELRSANYEKT